MNKIPIHLDVNGVPYDLLVDPGTVARRRAARQPPASPGTKRACNEGECASCAVHVDGTVVNSCLVLAVPGGRRQVTTIEGLASPEGTLHPIQRLRRTTSHSQCGFCTPGMIMTAKALLAGNPNPTERRDPPGDPRQHLPLHRLPEDLRGDPGSPRASSTSPVRHRRPRGVLVLGRARPRTAAPSRRSPARPPTPTTSPSPHALRRAPAHAVRPRAHPRRSTCSRRRRCPARVRRLHAGGHAADEVLRIPWLQDEDRVRCGHGALPGRGGGRRHRGRRGDRAARDRGDRGRLRAARGRLRPRGGDGRRRPAGARGRPSATSPPTTASRPATSRPASPKPTTSSRTASSRAASATSAWSRTPSSPTTTRRAA